MVATTVLHGNNFSTSPCFDLCRYEGGQRQHGRKVLNAATMEEEKERRGGGWGLTGSPIIFVFLDA